jgi:hypothetical protein
MKFVTVLITAITLSGCGSFEIYRNDCPYSDQYGPNDIKVRCGERDVIHHNIPPYDPCDPDMNSKYPLGCS